MPILEIKNLTKNFNGVKALNNLTISFEKGIITGLIGPNGSGKTTILNILSGLTKIDSGRLEINDSVRLDKIKPRELCIYGITRTFQDIKLFEQMSVLDHILLILTERNFFSALFSKHQKYHLKQAQEILEKVGLWEKRNSLALNLSYGQRKLLEIARALAMNSEIYFFDEPFAGLFLEMKKYVAKIFKELRHKKKTVILIEHNMDLIRELCDYIFVLDSGHLLAQGKPEKVLAKREVAQVYLGG